MLVKKVMDIIDIDMTVVVEFVIVLMSISIGAVGWESVDALCRSLEYVCWGLVDEAEWTVSVICLAEEEARRHSYLKETQL